MLCLFSKLLLHNPQSNTILLLWHVNSLSDSRIFFIHVMQVNRAQSRLFWLYKIHISLSTNEDKVIKELHEMIDRHANSYPDTAIIILGDFKYCDLQESNPKFHQFVNFLLGKI